MSNGQGPAVFTPAQAVAAPVARARGARMAVLIGPEQHAPRFVTRRFSLEPGGRIPAHRHPDIEHEQVVLRGEMTLTLDGVERVARAGDAVWIPAGTAHSYQNDGAEEVEFICVIPNVAGYSTDWLEDPPEGAHLPE